MITENSYFSDNLNEINREIININQNIESTKNWSIHDFSKSNITERFNEIFRVFPYAVETASESIGMSLYAIELFDLFHEISTVDGKIDSKRIEQSKDRFKNPLIEREDKYLINDFLEDYFHSIVYSYGLFVENTKKYHFFYGIDCEEVILKNLLNIYRTVTQDKTKQLNIFLGITLTKKISDIVTRMLIDFIEQRLVVLNPTIELENVANKLTFVDNKLTPIKWLGTQQELCELFIELISRKWIPEIEFGGRKKVSNTITTLFDLEITKRNENSNPNESFYQIFKGEQLHGEISYNFLESIKYKRKFDRMDQNNR